MFSFELLQDPLKSRDCGYGYTIHWQTGDLVGAANLSSV